MTTESTRRRTHDKRDVESAGASENNKTGRRRRYVSAATTVRPAIYVTARRI